MTDTGILVTLALALVAATIGGAIAVRLGQSPILGYVVAGVIIGPYTAGPVAQPETVAALADVGLVFLLFGVGLQLSFGELLRVGKVAIVGGSVQVVAMVVIGYFVGIAIGFRPLESLFFGAFISQSSSAVMAKILGERGELDSPHGHVALGWATLQDLSTIVLVVLLGALSMGGDLVGDIISRHRQSRPLPGDPAAARPEGPAVALRTRCHAAQPRGIHPDRGGGRTRHGLRVGAVRPVAGPGRVHSRDAHQRV